MLVVLGFVLNKVVTNTQMDAFAANSQLQAEQVDASMDTFLTGLRDGLVNMANDPVLKQGGDITKYFDASAGTPGSDGMIAMEPAAKGGFEAQAYALFERFGQANKSTVSVVSYGTVDGGYLQYPAVKRKTGYDSRKRDWFTDSMKDTNAVRITDPFKTSKGTPTVGIFAVVKSDSGEPRGVLGLNIDLPVMTDRISQIQIGETGYFMVLDKNGVIVADPKHPDKDFTKLSEADLGELSSLDLGKKGLQEIDLDGASKFVSVYASDKTGYQYLTIVDRSQVLASANHIRIALIIGLVVALILVFFATLGLSNLIVHPLRGLETAAEGIADGDLRETALEIETDDEIGHLATSFHTMTEHLRTLLKQIKGSSDEVSEASEQMSQGVEQVAQTITHVGAASQRRRRRSASRRVSRAKRHRMASKPSRTPCARCRKSAIRRSSRPKPSPTSDGIRSTSAKSSRRFRASRSRRTSSRSTLPSRQRVQARPAAASRSSPTKCASSPSSRARQHRKSRRPSRTCRA